MPDLFSSDGHNYEACASYTCGQWDLFHILTVHGPRVCDDVELPVAMYSAFRNFVAHFLNCLPCRKHFLAANTIESMGKLHSQPEAERGDYLIHYMWSMHNSVNRRIGHPEWPKKKKCPTCHDSDEKAKLAALDYLKKFYGYGESYATKRGHHIQNESIQNKWASENF